MSDAAKALISPLLSYSAISVALLIPVLFWPLQSINDGSLDPSVDFHTIWLVTASALLLCAVTADSILYHEQGTLWPFFATAWILTFTMGVSLALRLDSGAFILASMFTLHAIRAGSRIWQDQNSWWLWPACVRDAVAAMAMFTWIITLSTGAA
ncbi:hypothetical protein [Mariprofundus sp. KV]|uniref:hypothetical protein n=1 Tax=Mariprofundus sp. KV TaxID=2608715 RepID=UPI0015A36562|nr:hypothetical protein [Mariprofundus sp. KV]NWF35180.1 hypothetical protein [Mariprofundus sp. KV]